MYICAINNTYCKGIAKSCLYSFTRFYKTFPNMRVCHKSMTHPFSQKAPTCKLLSCSLRKFSVLFTTKPKLSQARALSFCKKVVSLQKTFIEYGKDTNKIRN